MAWKNKSLGNDQNVSTTVGDKIYLSENPLRMAENNNTYAIC